MYSGKLMPMVQGGRATGASIDCRHACNHAPACRGTGAAGARPKGVWEIMDSLRDISPDDLFPGVAYSISEDDGDEEHAIHSPSAANAEEQRRSRHWQRQHRAKEV